MTEAIIPLDLQGLVKIVVTQQEEIGRLESRLVRSEAQLEALTEREEKRKSALFSTMLDKALAGDNIMLIWLSKQLLGFQDRPGQAAPRA